jgi:hypothetical protein
MRPTQLAVGKIVDQIRYKEGLYDWNMLTLSAFVKCIQSVNNKKNLKKQHILDFVHFLGAHQ